MVRLLEPVVERLRPTAGRQDADDPPAGSIERRLLTTAETVFDDDLSLDSTKEDVVGWDSLGNMNLVVALEDEFDVDFDESVLHDADSLRDLAEAIRADRE